MRRTTRSQTQATSSTTAPTTPPATPSNVDLGPLPAPLTTRNLRSRLHRTESRASSTRGSRSAATSRSGSAFPDHPYDEVSSVASARGRKRRRIAIGAETIDEGGNLMAGGGSHISTAPRPDWRHSEGHDDEEELDQLDESDAEDNRSSLDSTAPQDRGQVLSRSEQPAPSTSTEVEVVASSTVAASLSSSRHRSVTPPPLTAISATDGHSQGEGLGIFSSSFTRPLAVDAPSSSATTTTLNDSSPSSIPSSSSILHGQGLRETFASPVSSPSLMKIINQTNIEPGAVSMKRRRLSGSSEPEIVEVSTSLTKNKGKGKAKAPPFPTPAQASSSSSAQHQLPSEKSKELEVEPLSEYTCPICFFPPSNATLTPCGHVCCGSCLFTAVKTTLQRGVNTGTPVGTGENVARCPVCRAVIPGWDGKGGGVIGIKVRQVISL